MLKLHIIFYFWGCPYCLFSNLFTFVQWIHEHWLSGSYCSENTIHFIFVLVRILSTHYELGLSGNKEPQKKMPSSNWFASNYVGAFSWLMFVVWNPRQMLAVTSIHMYSCFKIESMLNNFREQAGNISLMVSLMFLSLPLSSCSDFISWFFLDEGIQELR